MTRRAGVGTLVLASAEDGCIRTPDHRGGSGLWRRGEIPVLDCSMVKLHFRRRSPAGICVFLAHSHQILLSGVLADGQLSRHRLQRQAGCVELKSSCFLLAEGRPGGGVIGGEDVGEAGGETVPARRAPPSSPPPFSG